jgi:hypothetical protein
MMPIKVFHLMSRTKLQKLSTRREDMMLFRGTFYYIDENTTGFTEEMLRIGNA